MNRKIKWHFGFWSWRIFVPQGAIPELLENTKQEFFDKTVDILRQTADICWEKLKGISGITCPSKPEGSMFVMVSGSGHVATTSCEWQYRSQWLFCQVQYSLNLSSRIQDFIFFLSSAIRIAFCWHFILALTSRFVQDVLWDTRIGSGSRSQSGRLLSKTALTGSSPSARDTASLIRDTVSSQVPCKMRHLLSYK